MLICLCDYFYFFLFFKQKTAYEMRISDWSSDVCSSDLSRHGAMDKVCVGGWPPATLTLSHSAMSRMNASVFPGARRNISKVGMVIPAAEIGRASCRERVCQYV